MSSQWYDRDGDAWDRACTYCCNCHEKIGEYSAKRLDHCKVIEKPQFNNYERQGLGNGCPDFRTDTWVS